MENLESCICITPCLPPETSGVGDYALKLAQQLRQDFGLSTHFLVGDSRWVGTDQMEEFPTSRLDTHLSIELQAQLKELTTHSNPIVLMHYVGYGYAKRGCPTWLIEGLEQWKAKTPEARLVTMFHEIYASGPLWTSAFWLSPIQRNLAIRLTKSSDRCFTSKQSYAQTLYQLSRKLETQIVALPVFSNVGEPKEVRPVVQRTRRLITFGHRNSRLQIYQRHFPVLEHICQTLGITEICDVGTPTGLKISQLNGIPVLERGVMRDTEISKLLLDSVVGFQIFPPPVHLAKSTIFAAYCAHGLIPTLLGATNNPTDGLQVGKHYWSWDDRKRNKLSLNIGQTIANNAYDWYQTHSLSMQARVFATHLTNE